MAEFTKAPQLMMPACTPINMGILASGAVKNAISIVLVTVCGHGVSLERDPISTP